MTHCRCGLARMYLRVIACNAVVFVDLPAHTGMASRGGVIGNRNVGPKAPLSRKPAPPPSIAKNVPGVKSAAAVAHAALRSPGVTYKTAAGATTAAAGVAPVAHPNAGSSTAFNAANVSALFGLPPVADELRVVLEGNPKPEFGRDYNDILAATDNIGRPRNALPGSDRKVRNRCWVSRFIRVQAISLYTRCARR